MSEALTGMPASSSARAREGDDFLEVVLADPDLLAAEFDAIIEEAWSGSGAASAASTRRPVAEGPPAPRCDERSCQPAPGPPRPPGARVRSPPRT